MVGTQIWSAAIYRRFGLPRSGFFGLPRSGFFFPVSDRGATHMPLIAFFIVSQGGVSALTRLLLAGSYGHTTTPPRFSGLG